MSRFNQNTVAEFYAEHKGREYIALGLRNGETIIKLAENIMKDNEVTRVLPDVIIHKKKEYRKFAEKHNIDKQIEIL